VCLKGNSLEKFPWEGVSTLSGLSINISKLSEGVHHHSLSANPDEIGLDGRFQTTVHVEATVEKTSRQLLVQSTLHCTGTFTCDRCLDEFSRDIDAGFSIVYVQGQPAPGENAEDQPEVQYLSPDTNIIDLGEDVRQYILLALPLKMLCKKDCAGLCPVCGINRNKSKCSCRVEETDPRWADLKRLLNN